MTSKPLRAVFGLVPASAGLAAALALGVPSSARAESWPADMRAVYDVNFNGFNVGTFEFQSQSEEDSYTLTGNAQLTLLLGAFTWIGETRAFGFNTPTNMDFGRTQDPNVKGIVQMYRDLIALRRNLAGKA